MKFKELEIPGVYLIEYEPIVDNRGSFVRIFCKKEFIQHNLNPDIVQSNYSFNSVKGTLRGLHYQRSPFEETKVVLCSRGSIYDVIVDLRPESSMYKSWIGLKLNESVSNCIYIPTGCAHGFQTLEDNTLVLYFMGNYYNPDCVSGIKWNDPDINISWPLPVTNISERDKNNSNFR